MECNRADGVLVFTDIETTGGPAQEPIEIAQQVYAPGKELETSIWHMLPEESLVEEATKVHGFTYAKMFAEGFEPIREVMPQYAENIRRLEEQHDKIYWLGYNSDQFDYPHLEQHLKTYAGESFSFVNRIDIIRIARRVLEPVNGIGYSLDAVHERLFPSRKQELLEKRATHSADVDLELTADVAVKLLRLVPKTLDSWGDLCDWCINPQTITTMPFGKHAGKPLAEVPEDYLRWFLRQDWAEKWDDLCHSLRQLGIR